MGREVALDSFGKVKDEGRKSLKNIKSSHIKNSEQTKADSSDRHYKLDILD